MSPNGPDFGDLQQKVKIMVKLREEVKHTVVGGKIIDKCNNKGKESCCWFCLPSKTIGNDPT
jgi:hypothetical protein